MKVTSLRRKGGDVGATEKALRKEQHETLAYVRHFVLMSTSERVEKVEFPHFIRSLEPLKGMDLHLSIVWPESRWS